MITIADYLLQSREMIPEWLVAFKVGDNIPLKEFFSSRVVYYPGSGSDGRPIAIMNSAHAAHCYVYVDYLVNKDALVQQLAGGLSGCRGYHSLARVDISEQELEVGSWDRLRGPRPWPPGRVEPFAFCEIFERDLNREESYGAARFAVLFLGADGISAFDALFKPAGHLRPPYCVVLQDHGFGGNYDKFGGCCRLSVTALSEQIIANYLLVAEHTDPWMGYRRCGTVPWRGYPHPSEEGRALNLFEVDATFAGKQSEGWTWRFCLHGKLIDVPSSELERDLLIFVGLRLTELLIERQNDFATFSYSVEVQTGTAAGQERSDKKLEGRYDDWEQGTVEEKPENRRPLLWKLNASGTLHATPSPELREELKKAAIEIESQLRGEHHRTFETLRHRAGIEFRKDILPRDIGQE